LNVNDYLNECDVFETYLIDLFDSTCDILKYYNHKKCIDKWLSPFLESL